MAFIRALEILTGVSRDKIGIYMIHLERAKDRIQMIQELQNKLEVEFTMIQAVEGRDAVAKGHPNSPSTGGIHNPGAVGCTMSHILACRTALETGKEFAVIFEDDCMAKKTAMEILQTLVSVKNICHTYNLKWDMFILGALGYPSHLPSNIGISPIYAFDGTHSILLNKYSLRKYIESYSKSLEKNQMEAADGIYTGLARNEGLICIGFTDSKLLFDQNQDNQWSYVGDIMK